MDLYCDWNSDLILTPNGSLQAAVGWDQIRQRIIRRMITNPARVQPNGIATQADYVFHPDFGFGLGALVDGNYNASFIQDLRRRVSLAVFEDDDIDSSSPPTIQFDTSQPNALWIIIGVTLTNGKTGQIALQVA